MIKTLLVDDEPFIRVAIKTLFDWEEHGFEIVGEANNGEAALLKLEYLNVDLIITDIKMPIKDGISLIRHAKEKHPHIQCVVLSNYNDFKLTRAAFLEGAVDYLLKNDLNTENFSALANRLKSGCFKDYSNDTSPESLSQSCAANPAEQEILAIQQLLEGNKSPEAAQSLDKNHSFVMAEALLESLNSSSVPPSQLNENLLQNTVLKIISEISEFQLYYYAVSATDYVLLIYNGELSSAVFYKKLDAFFHALSSNIQSYLNQIAVVGISSLYSDTLEIPDAFAQAHEQAEKIFYCTESTVFYHHMQPKCISQVRQFINSHIDAVTVYIDEQNWDELESYFSELVSLLTSEQVAPDIAKRLLANLIFLTLNGMNQNTNETSSLLLNTEMTYDQIFYSSKITDITLHLNQFLETVKKQRHLQPDCLEAFSDITAQAIQYLRAHYRDPDISLSSVSKTICVNPSYLSRLFYKETKQHFNSYLTELRINYAKKLLSSTKDSINTISEKCGYNSCKYFITTFKSQEGCTPASYRNQNPPS